MNQALTAQELENLRNLVLAGQYDEATDALFPEAEDELPNRNPDELLLLVTALALNGEEEVSDSIAEFLGETLPEGDWRLERMAAMFSLTEGDLDTVFELVNEILESHPNDPETLTLGFWASLQADAINEAQEYLEKMRKQLGNTLPVLVNEAQMYAALGDWARTGEVAAKLVAMGLENDSMYRALLVRAKYELGDEAGAQQLVDEYNAKARSEGQPEGMEMLLETMLILSDEEADPEDILALAEQGLAKKPEDLTLRLFAIGAKFDSGKEKAAIKELEQFLDKHNNEMELVLLVSDFYESRGFDELGELASNRLDPEALAALMEGLMQEMEGNTGLNLNGKLN